MKVRLPFGSGLINNVNRMTYCVEKFYKIFFTAFVVVNEHVSQETRSLLRGRFPYCWNCKILFMIFRQPNILFRFSCYIVFIIVTGLRSVLSYLKVLLKINWQLWYDCSHYFSIALEQLRTNAYVEFVNCKK